MGTRLERQQWRVRDVLSFAETYLRKHRVEHARREAEWLLGESLGLSRLNVYLNLDRPLSEEERGTIRNALKRRGRHEPLAYILGVQPFRGLRIEVSSDVLIPRPETEELVDVVWDRFPERKPLAILDLCTGSGCIACALAHERPEVQVVATDISEEAATVARLNAGQLGVDDRIAVRSGNLFDTVNKGETFDAIVSNPPYISSDDSLPPSVAMYEPPAALYAGKGGLDLLRRIIEEAPFYLCSGGLLAMEFGHDQPEAIEKLLHDSPHYSDVEIVKDLSGKQRFAVARLVGR